MEIMTMLPEETGQVKEKVESSEQLECQYLLSGCSS